MTDVVVLGASGMLGSMVADLLSRNDRLHIRATCRSQKLLEKAVGRSPEIEWVPLDVERSDDEELRRIVDRAAWVVNAIGVIKPYIRDDSPSDRERAIRVNCLFPHRLAKAGVESGARILQIATDCVFSGERGRYVEGDPHDALDVYGKTKSLGELPAPGVLHLRCSIVGPEPKNHVSLLDWLLRQPINAEVHGFTNHRWNGLTTLQFARIVEGMATSDLPAEGVQHVVPSGAISKADLLAEFAKAFGRQDLSIRPRAAEKAIDRTLATGDEAANLRLWEAAGYPNPPSVPDMIRELAGFDYRFAGIQP